MNQLDVNNRIKTIQQMHISTNKIPGMTSQKLRANNNNLINSLLYYHFIEPIKIDNPVERKYYELLPSK